MLRISNGRLGALGLGLAAAIALFAATTLGSQPAQVEAQVIELPCGGLDVFACLTIVKVTSEDTDEEFHIDNSLGSGFNLGDGDSETIYFFNSNVTSVTVSEDQLPGWVLTDIECDSPGGDVEFEIDEDEATVIVSFAPRNDREATCTFYNAPDDDDDEDEGPSFRPNVGGAFAGDGGAAERNRARANAAGAAAAAATAPAPSAAVRPPSTGDGGLR